MVEIPFFFTREEVSLFGMRHEPHGQARQVGFVMSHPFAEEKLWSHRVYVSCARALAQLGYPVLRFDYMGAGDSDGTTPETSLETHLADLEAAANTLLASHAVERVGLIGLRLGATMAALLAERAAADGRLERLRSGPLILWDPVLDGESYFQEILRSNLGTQLAIYGKVQENREALQDKLRAGGTVNVDGYEIGKPLFESCAIKDLLSATQVKRHHGPALVIQIAANDQIKDRDELRALAQSYGNGTFARAVEQPFWREIKAFYARAENLQAATLA